MPEPPLCLYVHHKAAVSVLPVCVWVFCSCFCVDSAFPVAVDTAEGP